MNPLNPSSDKHPVSPYSYYLIKQTGHENKGNDHQLSNVLIFNQILPTSNVRNIRRIVRRILMLTLGLKRLMSKELPVVHLAPSAVLTMRRHSQVTGCPSD